MANEEVGCGLFFLIDKEPFCLFVFLCRISTPDICIYSLRVFWILLLRAEENLSAAGRQIGLAGFQIQLTDLLRS